jgi:hypothetical protein
MGPHTFLERENMKTVDYDKEIFVNEIDWMHNNYPVDIKVGGLVYPTVEHAYQAAKFDDLNIKQKIADLPASKVKRAKDIGRKTKGINPKWDHIKATVMKMLIRQKFFSREDLGLLLINTGNAAIVFKSNSDIFWGRTGTDEYCGDNVLGEILEEIRAEFNFFLGTNNKYANVTLLQYLKTLIETPDRKEELLKVISGLYNLYLQVKEFTSNAELNIDSLYNGNTDTLDYVSEKIEIIQENVNNIEEYLKNDQN